MKLRNVVLSAIVCSLALPVMAAAPIAKPGRWQTTVQMEMPNMPMKIPAQTYNVCVTKEQSENGESLIPKTGDKRGGCTYTDVKVDGNTISWKIACDKSGMTGAGTITYHGESYEGSMQMKMRDQDVSGKMSGKYVGACDGTEISANK
jgi:hypothetical protein